MGIQVISRDGQPEYAVVPWEQYQALLKAAGQGEPVAVANTVSSAPDIASLPPFSELTRLREGKGLAPEQLARSVGISPVYLALIENGERQPDAAIRRSLAWELGVVGWSEPS
ncbi:helix-turn-helix domain-containing protein [Pseudomonas rubra]|uniref:Helix-turn-helix domain-containing protein n=1 Tax=Pseudomonas rubra TaxID=2942627 RepID=A0ABT5P5I2_9PSED|nr:helix-turn-helix transcriptional regulator [Pseudomonas rubra]MDD1013559.1 helix-turn-helix domain-containing protein [Pseudomonas rubra]MDD1040123.1 helix-turn-helix domain-containing protein [Pseudomonas rubra]MDD1155871.1 helix-turn-helix domain-containing protein [Pseudomonas rubra]